MELVDPISTPMSNDVLPKLERVSDTQWKLSWDVPARQDLVAWQVVVYDIQTYEASVWRPIVYYCSCQNGAVCSFDYLSDTHAVHNAQQVYVGRCTCPKGYVGEFCERSDLCSNDPQPCSLT